MSEANPNFAQMAAQASEQTKFGFGLSGQSVAIMLRELADRMEQSGGVGACVPQEVGHWSVATLDDFAMQTLMVRFAVQQRDVVKAVVAASEPAKSLETATVSLDHLGAGVFAVEHAPESPPTVLGVYVDEDGGCRHLNRVEPAETLGADQYWVTLLTRHRTGLTIQARPTDRAACVVFRR